MMLEDDEYRLLQQHAGSRAIPLSASVFDTQGLELLNSLQPEYIKIASCDLNNYPFLREASQYGKTLILSTGMANLSEIEKAVDTVKSSSGTDLVLMHCVSVYPCSVERTNLSFVRTLQSAFGVPVGFSDHTESSIAACVAVSMGVQWIEKHFTWSRQAEGFDHAYAMEPSDFGQYVKDIRSVESAMIRPHRKTSKDEENTKCRARRGLFAARQIEQGEVLTEQDVMIVRPETDLAPGDLSLITGRTAKRKIDCCEPLGLDQWE
jgi:sialic acid synthase SpsE